MKAIIYDGMKDVEVAKVEDPKIEKADDIIVKVTSTAICGSDLHLIHILTEKLEEFLDTAILMEDMQGVKRNI